MATFPKKNFNIENSQLELNRELLVQIQYFEFTLELLHLPLIRMDIVIAVRNRLLFTPPPE